MADLTDYILPFGVGSRVVEITGKGADGFSAGGYSAFVQSVTGRPPTVARIPDSKRARLLLDNQQAVLIQKWLDRQLAAVVAKPKEVSLEIELNPVFVPWVLKYAVPASLLLILIGWVGHWYIAR